jgi:5-methylcytosine-specific restriction endonuclease McrA
MDKDELSLRFLSALLIHRVLNKARSREYRHSHKEQCKQYIDPQKQKEASRRYCKKYPEKVNANAKRWRENNPEKFKILCARRTARERSMEGDFTLEEWNSKLEEYNYRCAYCGCELNTETITIDHMIPIVRGGTNYIDNLVPACRSCNSRKHTKTAEEYLGELERNI